MLRINVIDVDSTSQQRRVPNGPGSRRNCDYVTHCYNMYSLCLTWICFEKRLHTLLLSLAECIGRVLCQLMLMQDNASESITSLEVIYEERPSVGPYADLTAIYFR